MSKELREIVTVSNLDMLLNNAIMEQKVKIICANIMMNRNKGKIVVIVDEDVNNNLYDLIVELTSMN